MSSPTHLSSAPPAWVDAPATLHADGLCAASGSARMRRVFAPGMARPLRSLGLLLFVGSALCAVPASARSNEPAPAAPSAPSAAPSHRAVVRHVPDAATRQAMDEIRALLAPQRPGIEARRLAPADYQALATQVNRRLDAAASAGSGASAATSPQRRFFASSIERDLRWATDTMLRSPKVEVQHSAALAMFHTLRNYGTYFDHPGWTWP